MPASPPVNRKAIRSSWRSAEGKTQSPNDQSRGRCAQAVSQARQLGHAFHALTRHGLPHLVLHRSRLRTHGRIGRPKEPLGVDEHVEANGTQVEPVEAVLDGPRGDPGALMLLDACELRVGPLLPQRHQVGVQRQGRTGLEQPVVVEERRRHAVGGAHRPTPMGVVGHSPAQALVHCVSLAPRHRRWWWWWRRRPQPFRLPSGAGWGAGVLLARPGLFGRGRLRSGPRPRSRCATS